MKTGQSSKELKIACAIGIPLLVLILFVAYQWRAKELDSFSNFLSSKDSFIVLASEKKTVSIRNSNDIDLFKSFLGNSTGFGCEGFPVKEQIMVKSQTASGIMLETDIGIPDKFRVSIDTKGMGRYKVVKCLKSDDLRKWLSKNGAI